MDFEGPMFSIHGQSNRMITMKYIEKNVCKISQLDNYLELDPSKTTNTLNLLIYKVCPISISLYSVPYQWHSCFLSQKTVIDLYIIQSLEDLFIFPVKVK